MSEIKVWAIGLVLAVVIVFGIFPLAITAYESLDADNTLRSDFNATPIIESAPPTNQGKPAPSCAECADWSGQWIRGADGYDHFVIKHKGRDVTREVSGPDIFSKTPLKGRQ